MKSLVDEARAILNDAMRGSTNQRIDGARGEMGKATAAVDAGLKAIQGIDDKFDEYMEIL